MPLFESDLYNEGARLLAYDQADRDCFGWSVAVSGDIVVVGAPCAHSNGKQRGQAYVFAPPR